MISREKEAKGFRLFVCSIFSLSLSIRKKPIVAFPVTWHIMTRITNSPTNFEKIYAALPEQLEVNIKICSCWINFDSHFIAMFTGIADDHLIPLVLNKFDKKTQRQLAEIWSYGWILHGVIFCRTQLRKHHNLIQREKIFMVVHDFLMPQIRNSKLLHELCKHLLRLMTRYLVISYWFVFFFKRLASWFAPVCLPLEMFSSASGFLCFSF